jgi:hypothetical protein
MPVFQDQEPWINEELPEVVEVRAVSACRALEQKSAYSVGKVPGNDGAREN